MIYYIWRRIQLILSQKKPTINKPVQCDICGSMITYFNKTRHLRTKRHKDMLYIYHEKIDIK